MSTQLTFTHNGKRLGVDKWALTVSNICKDHIEEQLRVVSLSLVSDQIKKDNPPSEVVVDGTATKSIANANRVVYARFGNRFDKKIVSVVEGILSRNIRKMTTTRTGKLSNVRQNWQWYLVNDKTSVGRPVEPRQLKTLQRGQKLVLVPKYVENGDGENYATMANMWSTRRTTYRADRRYRKADGPVPQVGVNKGFIGRTTQTLNRRGDFKNAFYARGGFTERFKLPGEVRKKYGTVFISISPRIKLSRSETRGKRGSK
jgi:hypothetical protein